MTGESIEAENLYHTSSISAITDESIEAENLYHTSSDLIINNELIKAENLYYTSNVEVITDELISSENLYYTSSDLIINNELISSENLYHTSSDLIINNELIKAENLYYTSSDLIINNELIKAENLYYSSIISIVNDTSMGSENLYHTSSTLHGYDRYEPSLYAWYNVIWNVSLGEYTSSINPYYQREALISCIYPICNWEYSQSFLPNYSDIITGSKYKTAYGYNYNYVSGETIIGYDWTHYINVKYESLGTYNQKWGGCLQTKYTTPDLRDPVEVFISNPNRLVVDDDRDIRLRVE